MEKDDFSLDLQRDSPYLNLLTFGMSKCSGFSGAMQITCWEPVGVNDANFNAASIPIEV